MEALTSFVESIRTIPTKVGSITPPQQHFLRKFLEDHPEIKTILETGFHIGLSAAVMLSVREDIFVTSFDILWFDYTRRSKLLLDVAFPDRNLLIAGNSATSLPTFLKQHSAYSPDMVFVDGGHERPIPFIDLHHILDRVKEGTWILIDDYCLAHGSQGVIEAVNVFIKHGALVDVQFYRAFDRGWAVGRRSATPIPPSELVTPEAIAACLRITTSTYAT
jgi:predicted O-methyltransferase YrrM